MSYILFQEILKERKNIVSEEEMSSSKRIRLAELNLLLEILNLVINGRTIIDAITQAIENGANDPNQ